MKRVYKFGLMSLEGVNRTFLGNRTLLPAEPQVSPLGTPCFSIPQGGMGVLQGSREQVEPCKNGSCHSGAGALDPT